MSIRKTLPALALAAAVALTAAACGTTGASTDNKPAPVESVAQPDEPLETPAGDPEGKPADTSEGPLVKAWGETFTWDDGLAVSVAQPTGYAPGEYAAGTEGFTSFIITTVTITNGTDAAYDPAGLSVAGTSGNVAVSEVFDSGITELGGNQYMMASVLPGQTVSFPVAFGVANTADITLEVSPGLTASDDDTDHDTWSYDAGYFQGAAA